MQDSKRHHERMRALQVPEHATEGFLAVLEAIERCERTFEPQFTAFLDPEARVHGEKCFHQTDCRCVFFGGYEDAEYQVLGVFPAHEEAPLAHPVTALEIRYQEQFGKLEHKDVLGTLMSLGIERKVIGDILVGEGVVHFFALSHLERYLIDHLEKIKRQGVQVTAIPCHEVPQPLVEKQEVSFSVSSLRLDAIVSQAFHLSRTQAANCIKQGFVKVDYLVVDKIDLPVGANQLISVRRQGRFWVGEVTGISKKGKLRLSGWITRV